MQGEASSGGTHRPPVVAVFSADVFDQACATIRLVGPLRDAAWDVRWGTQWSERKFGLDLGVARGADLVIVQRLFPRDTTQAALDGLARLGVPLVYDLDDDFLDVPRRHPNRTNIAERFAHVRWMLRQADLVCASTEVLAGSLRRRTGRPVVVQPNLVDVGLFDAEPRDRGTTCNILVSGTPTHFDDWALIEETLARVLHDHRGQVTAHFFGGVPARFQNHSNVCSIGFMPDYAAYAATLRRLDVHFALVPLLDTPFNRAKSNIKWLEYGAAGIPGVYSDGAAYRGSVTDGVDGLLVDNTADAWRAAIEALIASPALTRRLADAARDTVRRRHSITAGLAAYTARLGSVLGTPHRHDARADLAMRVETVPARLRCVWHRHVGWRFQQRA